jgi:anaerobic ribonucleoside-triphosphate reductase
MCLWNQYPKQRMFERFGAENQTYDLVGRVHMDYMQLYRKYTYEERHSYSLDAIGEYELDERKEWLDFKMWEKANPGLGTIKSLETLTENVNRAKNDSSFLPTLLTKDFNIKETGVGSWLNFEDINNIETYNIEDFKSRLSNALDIAKTSLEIKRKIIEEQTHNGLYPYSANYLSEVKARTGQYWFNHFNTIGLLGMNEALLNFIGEDITTEDVSKVALDIMNYMRDKLVEYQDETGHVFNLEATPAEGTSYRIAKIDMDRYKDIVTAGIDTCYYTNSTQIPVGHTDDIIETLDNQDELQSLYTGGTVLHLYLGETIRDIEVCKSLIKKIFTKYKLPYISITPTFSICGNHGYIAGEHFECPKCKSKTEVWSRVTGYLRPVENYNIGKREEYNNRKKFKLSATIE